MKVLMLSDFYPPLSGGVEQVVQALSRELVRRGHDVAVATMGTDDLPVAPRFIAGEVDEGVEVYRLRGLAQSLPGGTRAVFSDPRRPFHPPLADPMIVRQLARLLTRVQPDIVHAHSWLLYSFLPLKRRSGARLVVTLHDYGFFCPRKDLLHGKEVCSGPGPVKCLRCSAGKYGAPKALFIQSGLRLGGHFPDSRIDQYLAVSSFVAKVYSGQAGGAARPGETEQSAIIPLEVVPSFISDAVAHYRPRVRGGLPLPDRDFILFVGALGRHKGLAVLLQAYESLRRSALGTCSRESLVPLVLMGPRWPDTPSHFPEGVTVIHDAPHELVMEAWARCRLGVIPSICAETMGLAALEGLAMGRPVVASRVGGLTNIIRHGETGLLVTPGDVEDLQSAIQTLLTDRALGAQLGSAGRQHVLNRFTASVVVPRVEEIYARTLADQATPGAVQSGGHPEAPRESMPPARLAWPEPKAMAGNEPLSELGS